MKRDKSKQQNKPKFKKRDPNQDVTRATKGKLERGGGSQIVKPTRSTYQKKNVGKCLDGTNVFLWFW